MLPAIMDQQIKNSDVIYHSKFLYGTVTEKKLKIKIVMKIKLTMGIVVKVVISSIYSSINSSVNSSVSIVFHLTVGYVLLMKYVRLKKV